MHGRSAIDKGLHGGHLPVGPLHSDANRLLRTGEEGLVEAVQRNKAGVQLRNVADVKVDAKMFHSLRLLKNQIIHEQQNLSRMTFFVKNI